MFSSNISLAYKATLLIVASPILTLLIGFSVFFLQITFLGIYSSLLFSIFHYLGFIILLISVYGLAKEYQEPNLFRNMLYGFIVSVIGTVCFYVLEFVFFPFVFSDLSSIPYSIQTPGSLASLVMDFLVFSLILWIGLFVIALISGIFFRRSLYKLSEKSGEEHFKSAGFWIFLGGITSIVFIGAIFIFVAWIFAMLGFYSLSKKNFVY